MNLNYLLVFGIILFLRFYGENNDLYTGLGLIVIFFIMKNITEGIVNEEDPEENPNTVPNYTNEDITDFLSPTENNPSYGKITPAELLNSGTIGIDENIDKHTTALNSTFGENIRGIYSYNIPPSSPPSYPPSSPESIDFSELIRLIQNSKMKTFNNNDFYKSYIIGIIEKLTSDSNTELGGTLIASISELDLKANFFRNLHHNINVKDVDIGTKVDNVVMQLDDIFNRLFRISTLKHAFDIRGFVELYIFFVISIFSYYDNFFGDYDPDSEPQNIMEKYSVFLRGILIDSTAFIMMKCGPGGSGESDRRCIDARQAVTDNQYSQGENADNQYSQGENADNQYSQGENADNQYSPEEDAGNQHSSSLPEMVVDPIILGADAQDTNKCADYTCSTGTVLKSNPGNINRGSSPQQNCCVTSCLNYTGCEDKEGGDYIRMANPENIARGENPEDSCCIQTCKGYTCDTGTLKPGHETIIRSSALTSEDPEVNCCDNQCSSPLNYFANSSPNCMCSPLPDSGDEGDRKGYTWLCFEGEYAWLKWTGIIVGIIFGILFLGFLGFVWVGSKKYERSESSSFMDNPTSTPPEGKSASQILNLKFEDSHNKASTTG